jgi:hypothetical protein
MVDGSRQQQSVGRMTDDKVTVEVVALCSSKNNVLEEMATRATAESRWVSAECRLMPS